MPYISRCWAIVLLIDITLHICHRLTRRMQRSRKICGTVIRALARSVLAVIFCVGNGTADKTEVSTVAQKLTAAQRRALHEEADEWDHLSDEELARLFDEGKPVHIRLRRPPPKTLTVALDAIENEFREE